MSYEHPDDPAAARILNFILWLAVKENASEIYIDPGDKVTSVMHRINGELKEHTKVARYVLELLVHRIKAIAEAGHISWKVYDKEYSAQVSTTLTESGQNRERRLR